jgi:hypothetical protein
MSALVLPGLFLSMVCLIIGTTYLTARDHRREKRAEMEAEKTEGTTPQVGLETRRYRAKPRFWPPTP